MNTNFLNNYSGRLGAGDPYAGSTAQYINELAQINQRLADIEVQIVNPNISAQTVADMQAEKVRLMARKAAVQAWLALTTEQKNKVNALSYVNQLTQKYLGPLNKIKNQYQDGGLDMMDSLLNTQIAGMPLILALGIAGAVVYFIYSN